MGKKKITTLGFIQMFFKILIFHIHLQILVLKKTLMVIKVYRLDLVYITVIGCTMNQLMVLT